MLLSKHYIRFGLSVLMLSNINTTSLYANELTLAVQPHAAYEQGVAAFQAGDLQGAQQALRQAVSLAPDNPQYHYALSVLHSKAGNISGQWNQLRSTLELDPKHERAQQDFAALWWKIDQKELFNVGASAERIRSVLGEPDRIRPNESGEAWYYAFMSVNAIEGRVFSTNDWRNFDPQLMMPLEKLDIAVDDRNWTISHRSANRYNVMTEYVVPPQVVQNWTELFSTQRLLATAHMPLRKMVASLHEQTLRVNPNAKWHILYEDVDSILYEWRIEDSQGHPAQHEIARLIRGERDIYRVAYVAKVPALDKHTRNLWANLLQKATLTPKFTTDVQTRSQLSSDIDIRRVAWQAGITLSMAGLSIVEGTDAVLVDKLIEKARALTASMNITIDDPPIQQADSNEGTIAILRYLLETTGGKVAAKLNRYYGKEYADLFEMAIKANLLAKLYAPGDSLGLSIIAAVERNATRIGLPTEIWHPLVESVKAQASFDIVKHQLSELNSSIKRYLI